MNTLIKALLGTVVLIALMIGLPILFGILGLLWPILVVIGVIIFIAIMIGIGLGQEHREDK